LDSFSVDNNGNNNDDTITTNRRVKTETQLLQLAGRSAFAVTKRRSGYFAK